MKILQIVPAWPTAITVLAKQILRHNRDIDIKLVTFHPKRPDKKEIGQILDLWPKSDLIDMQYWKSGAKIKELFPDLWPKKRKILTHYNPYNLHEDSWEDYKEVIVVNNFQKTELPNARLLPLSVDLKFFSFNRSNYTTEPIVNMSVSRIEGKKGVAEVAQACAELKYKFILVGRIADGGYMKRVQKSGGEYLDFRNNVDDNKLKIAYHQSAVHVCNSIDGFESGTLPVLESMACGLPVLSRLVGHVPDIYNGKNIHILPNQPEDIESIKENLTHMMQDRRYRIQLRLEAEQNVQERSDVTRAASYRKLYEEFA